MAAIIIQTFEGKVKAVPLRNNENIYLFSAIKSQCEVMQSFGKGKMQICKEIANNLNLSVNKVYRVLTYIYEMKF
jgi:DNA-binding CsgD family transcriptional regulator